MEDVAAPQPARSGRRAAVRAWWPVVAYAGAIAVASSIPSSTIPMGRAWSYDKVIHAIEFALLAALVVRALALGPTRASGAVAAAIAVLAAAGFGACDEWHQSFTPGRDPSRWDLAADTFGAVVGAAAALVRYRSGPRGRGDREERDGHDQEL